MLDLMNRFVVATNDSTRIQQIIDLQKLQCGEFEQISQHLKGMPQNFGDQLMKIYYLTDSPQLKLEILRFVRIYIDKIGYEKVLDVLFTKKYLLQENLNRYLLREALKLIKLYVVQNQIAIKEHIEFVFLILSNMMKNLQYNAETYQKEYIDLCCQVLVQVTILPEKMGIPVELFDTNLLSAYNLLFLQNDLQYRYHYTATLDEVRTDFQLLCYVQEYIHQRNELTNIPNPKDIQPEDESPQIVDHAISLYKDVEKVADHITYQMNIFLAFEMGMLVADEITPIMINFLCEKFFLYQNLEQLHYDRSQSSQMFFMDVQPFNVIDVFDMILENQKVSVPQQFVREVLFCIRFNGNKRLLQLVEVIFNRAENKDDIIDEFNEGHWGDILQDIEQKFNKDGSLKQNIDNINFMTKGSKQ